MSKVTRYTMPGIDAFDLYVKTTRRFGEYQAFLLDSLNGPVKTPYEMSLLGVLPLIEIRVKSKVVTIDAEEHVAQFLYKQLNDFRKTRLHFAFHREFRSEVDKEQVAFFRVEFHDCDPMEMLEQVRMILRDLMKTTNSTPFSCGFLGYFGYDAIRYLEKLPNSVMDDRELPDIRFQFHGLIVQLTDDELVVLNHLYNFTNLIPRKTLQIFQQLTCALQEDIASGMNEKFDCKDYFAGAFLQSAIAIEDVPESVFKTRVNLAKEYIVNGDIFQIVISKRVRVQKSVHPYVAYARLRQKNPSPYMFISEYPDMRLFGASPEVQFRSVGNHAQMKPIAGTSKGRGETKEEDDRFRNQLVNNAKDKAEHIMLVDLCRNDLGRVCQTGTVKVDAFMKVEAYTHLFHLVSTVSGVLKEGVNIFRALLSTFPAGTLSGAPKIRAMELIDELESFARGPYGGFIGMVDLFGNANTAIIIRSVVEKDDTYFVQAGAGIVADSDALEEWQECCRKARAVLQVLTNDEECVNTQIGKSKTISSPTS